MAPELLRRAPRKSEGADDRLPSDRAATAAGPAAWPSVLAGASLTGTVAAAGWLTLRSMRWPLIHDAPLMHYIAARLAEGAVPYRDLFDMNFPGVYLAHLLALRLVGGGDLAFRCFDLALVAAVVAGLLVALRSYGAWAGPAAGALFWLHHVAGGAWVAGQRELILCVALVWVAAGAIEYAGSLGTRWLGLAGLSLGAAVWTKPHAALLLPLLLALAWRHPARVRAVSAVAAGVGVPTIAILAWLTLAGGLAAFADIVLGYLVPLYSRLGRVALLRALADQFYGPPVLGGLTAWAAAGLTALLASGRRDGRLAVLATGVVYGALHFWSQGRGWEYHTYPFVLFAVALGAAGLGTAIGAGRRLGAAGLVGGLVLIAAMLGEKGRWNLDPEWIATKQARVATIATTLAPLVVRGQAVQILDTTEGGIHALYRLGARQPTRFLYDFHFYHDVDHPYVKRLRAEFIEALRARPPGAVVVFERGWPSGGYERLDAFPALRAWLAAGYELRQEGAGYRIYATRSDR